jgi:uncharacterized protein (DUF433 family)
MEPIAESPYPASPYITWTGYGLRIAGTRVSLDTVVFCFQDGQTPEQIVESFSTIPLSHAYGAIAYYLEHEELIKQYLAEGDALVASIPPLRQSDPELYARLEAARLRLRPKIA